MFFFCFFFSKQTQHAINHWWARPYDGEEVRGHRKCQQDPALNAARGCILAYSITWVKALGRYLNIGEQTSVKNPSLPPTMELILS